MTATSFESLDLIEPIRRALRAQNYNEPTPIQSRAIPLLLSGHDLLGSAQTGSGKTAAFALPILQHLAGNRRPAGAGAARALVLAPTRELAAQIAESFAIYGKYLGLKQAVVYGGVGKRDQITALSRGVDILVATPGRLLDLMGEGRIRLDRVEYFVLDEADRMLDMGFLPDVRRVIAALPPKRQSLFFSATLPPEVLRLAESLLTEPQRIAVTAAPADAPRIAQRVLFVDREDKYGLLVHLLSDPAVQRALVFTRTKHRANRLAQQLTRNHIQADALHGNKSQSARQRALAGFHAGRIRVLVATDIAARGIDVEDISHVINFELPNEPESYVHRIGRTARAGKEGTAISFCDATEGAYLRDIERFLAAEMPVQRDHPFHSAAAQAAKPASKPAARPGSRPAARGPGSFHSTAKARSARASLKPSWSRSTSVAR